VSGLGVETTRDGWQQTANPSAIFPCAHADAPAHLAIRVPRSTLSAGGERGSSRTIGDESRNEIDGPKGAISNPSDADSMSKSRHFFVTKGARQAANVVDTVGGSEGAVASDQVSQRLVPTAHAHRPAMLSASLIANAVLACLIQSVEVEPLRCVPRG